MNPAQTIKPLYGMMAEFEHPEDLVRAVKSARAAGYRNIDGFTPFPIHGLAEAMEFDDRRLPWMVLAGGVGGCFAGFAMQVYALVFDYKLNVGGRPALNWPAFIPVTFEMTILGAAVTAVLGMLLLNELPEVHHPVFNVERFELASRTHFFLLIESSDPTFNLAETKKFLEDLKGTGVFEVEI